MIRVVKDTTFCVIHSLGESLKITAIKGNKVYSHVVLKAAMPTQYKSKDSEWIKRLSEAFEKESAPPEISSSSSSLKVYEYEFTITESIGSLKVNIKSRVSGSSAKVQLIEMVMEEDKDWSKPIIQSFLDISTEMTKVCVENRDLKEERSIMLEKSAQNEDKLTSAQKELDDCKDDLVRKMVVVLNQKKREIQKLKASVASFNSEKGQSIQSDTSNGGAKKSQKKEREKSPPQMSQMSQIFSQTFSQTETVDGKDLLGFLGKEPAPQQISETRVGKNKNKNKEGPEANTEAQVKRGKYRSAIPSSSSSSESDDEYFAD
jgi:hypothetical protein